MITSGQDFKYLLYTEDSNKTSLALALDPHVFISRCPLGIPRRHFKWYNSPYGAANPLFPLGKQSKTNKHIYLFPFHNYSLITECSQVPEAKRTALDAWPRGLSHTVLKPLCPLMGEVERKMPWSDNLLALLSPKTSTSLWSGLQLPSTGMQN